MRLQYNKHELLKLGRSKIELPDELTPQLAYLVGSLRDGCISETVTKEGIKRYVAWCSKSKEWLENTIIPQVVSTFKIRPRKITVDRNKFQFRVTINAIVEFFKRIFEHHGGKQLNWNIPSVIINSNEEIWTSYIRGFFDAEGGCTNVKNLKEKYPWQSSFPIRIWSSSMNPEICLPLENLNKILKKLEINSKVKPVKSSSKRTKFPLFCLTISQPKDKINFITKIGSLHSEKSQNLFYLKSLIEGSRWG